MNRTESSLLSELSSCESYQLSARSSEDEELVNYDTNYDSSAKNSVRDDKSIRDDRSVADDSSVATSELASRTTSKALLPEEGESASVSGARSVAADFHLESEDSLGSSKCGMHSSFTPVEVEALTTSCSKEGTSKGCTKKEDEQHQEDSPRQVEDEQRSEPEREPMREAGDDPSTQTPRENQYDEMALNKEGDHFKPPQSDEEEEVQFENTSFPSWFSRKQEQTKKQATTTSPPGSNAANGSGRGQSSGQPEGSFPTIQVIGLVGVGALAYFLLRRRQVNVSGE